MRSLPPALWAGLRDALADGEERTAFIREAVERELERREKAAAKDHSAEAAPD